MKIDTSSMPDYEKKRIIKTLRKIHHDNHMQKLFDLMDDVSKAVLEMKPGETRTFLSLPTKIVITYEPENNG